MTNHTRPRQSAKRWVNFARLFGVMCLAVAAYMVLVDSEPDGGVNRSADQVSLARSSKPSLPSYGEQSTRPIEQIRVGDRVLASNPEVSESERASWAEPNWNDWVQVSLQMPLPSPSDDAEPKMLDIQILRPESWLMDQLGFVVEEKQQPVTPPIAPVKQSETLTSVRANQSQSDIDDTELIDSPLVPLSPLRAVYRDIAIAAAQLDASGVELLGLTVEMDLPEMGAVGTAFVTNIQPSPMVHGNAGQVVTATFSHPPATQVLDVFFEGESDPIGVTDNHLFWSVNRQQFVPIGQMEVGERVQTFHGQTKRIEQQLARPGTEVVYNLEVYGEHVYFVGEQGLLAHNMCNAPNQGLTRLNPSDIRFSQTTVRKQGATVNSLADSMRRNGFIAEPEPGKFLDVVRMSDGRLTTLDNTRVLAARRAGVNVEARLFNFDDALPADPDFVRRFLGRKGEVPTTFGEAAQNRIGNQSGAFRRAHPLGSPVTGSAF